MSTIQGIDLYDNDGAHANPTGSYLIACVFYSVIMKMSPVGLPGKISFRDQVICDIPQEIALLLQRVAWETFQTLQ